MIYLKTNDCFIEIQQTGFTVSYTNRSNITCSDFYELHKFIATQSVEPCTKKDFEKSYKTNFN